MDIAKTTTNVDFEDPPIITLGDDLHGILGMNSTDSSIFTDILLRNKDKKDELDDEIKDILNEATETFRSAENIFTELKIVPPERKDVGLKRTILPEDVGLIEEKILFTETKDISDLISETIERSLLSVKETFVPEEVASSEGKSLFLETKDIPVHSTETIQPDLVINASLEQTPDLIIPSPPIELSGEPPNLATEYASLARSVLVPTPTPSLDGTKKFSCSICWKSFPDRRYLNRHFSKHTNRFTCPHCQKSFSRKESQMKHIPNCRVINPGPKQRVARKVFAKPRFACKECFQQFTRKENYHQHMFKHQGIRVLCHECQKTLSSWKSFLSHRKTHECTRTVYFCNHCAAVFMFKSNLRRHLRRTEKAPTIICNACNVRVKNEAILDRHKSQSTKKCVVCFQKFCLEKDLRKHRQILHPEIWFKCQLCDSGIIFTARSEHHLMDHVKKAHKLSLTFMDCYKEEWHVRCD